MDEHTEPDGSFVVTATSLFFDWALLLAAALCTIPTIRDALQGSFNVTHSTPLIGTALFLLGFLAVYERARFAFDPRLGVVRWSRKRCWWSREGSLPFSRVQSVVLQTSLGSTAVCPSYRIALITDQGELPLTIAYAAGKQQGYESVAAKIRTFLDLSPSPTDILMDSVRSAMAQGHTIDAINLVRRQKGGSLAEAKRFVEQLKPHP